MKPKSYNRLSFTLASAIAALLAGSHAHAANLYWDTDDSTAGAGGVAPSGTWAASGTTWSTSPNGTVAVPAYTTLSTDDLLISAGVAATGSPTITLSGTQDASSLTFQEGTTTISGASGIINLGGTGGKVIVNNGASAVIGATTDTIIGGSMGLTKSGVGTLTLNGTLANTFTGGLNVNGGALALNFANMSSPTDLVANTNALGLGGGRLLITGLTGAFTTDQTLGDVTVNSGGGSILGDKNGGTALNITLGTLTTTTSGGSLLVGAGGTAANAPVITTTSGTLTNGIYSARAVFFDGTANTGYDWATTLSAGPAFTLSGLAGGSYTALDLTAGTDTNNSTISASATVAGSRNTNSLKFAAPATAQTLTINSIDTLTLGNGGLLFTGAALAQAPRISGGTITAGNGSGSYDLVVHAYNSTNLSVALNNAGSATNNSAINSIIADNSGNPVTLVKNGPSPLHLGGANTFTGGIIVNQGDLQAGVATALNHNAITFNANSNFITTTATTSNGVITLNNNAQVTFVNNNTSFTTSGKVTGTGGISIERGGLGSNSVNLTATTNDFTGPIRFPHSQQNQNASLTVNSLADTTTLGEGNITFGFTPTAVTGISISQNFTYGSGATAPLTLDNRQFQLATTNAAQSINNSSTLAFTINSDLLVSSTTGKALTLGGGGTGLSTFAGKIANNAAPTTGSTILAIVKAASAATVTLASVEGIQVGDAISGTNITAGTTVSAVNRQTRVVTLSVASGAQLNSGASITTPNVVNSVSVTKSGTGTWALTGANTYTGATAINAGTLVLANTSAVQNSSDILMAIGTTLRLATDTAFTTLPTITGASGATATTLISDRATAGAGLTHALGTAILGVNTFNFTNGSNVTSGAASLSFAAVNMTSGSAGTTVLNPTTALLTIAGGVIGGGNNVARTLELGGTGTGHSIGGAIANGVVTPMALTKSNTSTWTLSGANTYTGNTTVNAGTLELADNAQLKFVLGATSGTNNSISGPGTVSLEGDFVIDTSAADALPSGTWTLENVTSLAGAYGSNFTVVGFTNAGIDKWTKPNGAKIYTFDETTGILTLTTAGYAAWIDGFFPGETNPLIIGVTADPDSDGIDNGAEMVLGGNPATGMDTALLPTIELVTNPVSTPAIPAGDYLLFTYRRTAISETALVAAACETDTDLVAPWTTAVNAVSGVVIQEDLNFSFTPAAPADTDRVRVYVPRGANTKLFGRLNVVVP